MTTYFLTDRKASATMRVDDLLHQQYYCNQVQYSNLPPQRNHHQLTQAFSFVDFYYFINFVHFIDFVKIDTFIDLIDFDFINFVDFDNLINFVDFDDCIGSGFFINRDRFCRICYFLLTSTQLSN